MKKLFLLLTLAVGTLGFSQVLIDDTGANTGTPDPSAALEIKSNDKGLLLPRLTVAPAAPAEGLMYFDTAEDCFKGWNGTVWQALSDCTPVPTTDYTISIADATAVTEGESQTFTVTLSPALVAGDVVTVDYLTTDGTATAGSDYTAISTTTLTFDTAGQTSLDITVATTDDAGEENDETYTVGLSNAGFTGSGSATIGTATATGTINDNDAVTPPPTGNLVENGSFESGETTGWDKAESGTVISTDSQEGSNAIRVAATVTRDLAQSVPVTAGETYTISYWYKIETVGDGTDTRIWSYWRNGTTTNTSDAASLRPSTYPTSTTWEEVTMTLTAPTGVDNLLFEVRTYSGATVLYDNFSVVQQ